MSSAEAPDPTQGNSAFGLAPFQAMHKPVALVASPKEGRINETRWQHPRATILTGPQAFRATWSSRESHPPCACLGRAAAAGLEGQPWGCGDRDCGISCPAFWLLSKVSPGVHGWHGGTWRSYRGGSAAAFEINGAGDLSPF